MTQSPSRQEFLKKWADGRFKWMNHLTETIGVVWRPDSDEGAPIRGTRCQEKGCPFGTADSDSRLCDYHKEFFKFNESLTGTYLDVRDLNYKWKPVEEHSGERLSIVYPGQNRLFVVDNPLLPDASQNSNHTGAQVIWKGFGKKKIRKSQRKRPAGYHGPRPDHDPLKRYTRESIIDIPMWAPPGKESEPIHRNIEDLTTEELDEIERQELIQQLIEEQAIDMRQ